MLAVMFSTCGKEKVNPRTFVVLGSNFFLSSSNVLFLVSMKHLSILIHNKLSSVFQLVWNESLSLAEKRVPSNTAAILQKKVKLFSWIGSVFHAGKRGSTWLREKKAGFRAKGCFKFLFSFTSFVPLGKSLNLSDNISSPAVLFSDLEMACVKQQDYHS